MLDVTSASVDGINLGRVDVEPQDIDAASAKLQAQRQANITQPNNRNFHALQVSAAAQCLN